jgi:hypothetical protein
MKLRSVQADKRAGRGEDQISSLGDTNLADHYNVPEPEYVPPPSKGLDSAYDEALLVMGDDGDDTGRITKVKFRVGGNGDAERTLAALAPRDLMSSGHGFLIRDPGEPPKTDWRTTCEVCGDPLPPPAAGEWFCQFREKKPASAMCNCNWCLHYQMWLRGEYRPRGGRPAKRCGTRECTKKAARERKRKSRARMSQKPPN